MALYEYVCKKKKCKHVMEKIIFNVQEEAVLKCEKCGGEVKRTLSVFNFEVHGYSAANQYSKGKK